MFSIYGLDKFEPVQEFCTLCGRATKETIEHSYNRDTVWRQCPKWGSFLGYLFSNKTVWEHTFQLRGYLPPDRQI